MKYLIALAARSAWNRRATLSLVVFSIALSVTLLLGVERLRNDVRESFAQSVSGTDLVVGGAAARCNCCCTRCSTWARPATTWTGAAP